MKTAALVPVEKEEYHPAPVPATSDVGRLRRAARSCRACPLWKNATCTVFGEGPKKAAVVLVGEQPGDHEDREGRPFVGPAGRLLDRALEAAGVARDTCYVTNAVKHFKWTPQGRRRLHAKPNAREMAACRPWLLAELHALEPEIVVCLGATATRQVTADASIKVTKARGQRIQTELGLPALITVHPSSLLRAWGQSDKEELFDHFVADLRRIHG
jgi:DNA polymerase